MFTSIESPRMPGLDMAIDYTGTLLKFPNTNINAYMRQWQAHNVSELTGSAPSMGVQNHCLALLLPCVFFCGSA